MSAVTLCALRPRHAAALARLLADPEVGAPWLGLERGPGEPGWATDFIGDRMAAARQGLGWSFAIECGGETVGIAGLRRSSPGDAPHELGICVRRCDWSRGMASAAVHALLEFAAWHDVEHVQARCGRSNHRSLRLLRRCGFDEVAPLADGPMHSWCLFEKPLRP